MIILCEDMTALAESTETGTDPYTHGEYDFVVDITVSLFVHETRAPELHLKRPLTSIITSKLPKITVQSSTNGGSDWMELNGAIMRRREELGFHTQFRDEIALFEAGYQKIHQELEQSNLGRRPSSSTPSPSR